MNRRDQEIMRTFVDLAQDVVERQPPPCNVIYDEIHKSEYCRTCEIGSLLQLIQHELEEIDND